MSTCRCNDTGRVLADRQKRPVEVACGACTPRRLAELDAMEAHIAAIRERVDAIEARINAAMGGGNG